MAESQAQTQPRPSVALRRPTITVQNECSSCPCVQFDANVWLPGMCRLCLHYHKPQRQASQLRNRGIYVVQKKNTQSERLARYLMSHRALLAAVQSAVVSVANAHDVEEESRLIADIQLVDDAFSVSQLDVREQLEEKDTEISELKLKVLQMEGQLLECEAALLKAQDDREALVAKQAELEAKAKQIKEETLRVSASPRSSLQAIDGAMGKRILEARTARARAQKEFSALLEAPIIQKCEGWLRGYEVTAPEESTFAAAQTSRLDFPQHDISYFRDNFMVHPAEFAELEKAMRSFKISRYVRIGPEDFHDHVNIFAVRESGQKVIVSCMRMLDDLDMLIGIVRTHKSDTPFLVPIDGSKKPKSVKDFVALIRKHAPTLTNAKMFAMDPRGENGPGSPSPNYRYLPLDLLELDRKLKVRSHKFGLIAVKPNQTSMEEVFSNSVASPELGEFLNFLGNKVTLKGWRGYKADLDVKDNSCGTHSYYTDWEDLEIMFHVSPMITPEARQRLIGNDIVVVVFLESGATWPPANLVSQVVHAQLVVQPFYSSEGALSYRVDVAVREGVPSTRPTISSKMTWELDDEFREMLLRKLVNCERASWKCSQRVRTQGKSLEEHYSATRAGHIDYIYNRHHIHAKEF